MITGKIHPIIPTPPAPKIERERNNDVIWTPEAIEWVRNAWITGLSTKAIADRFGQGGTKNHIVGVKSRNPGFDNRPSPIRQPLPSKGRPVTITPGVEAHIRELAANGIGTGTIARLVGVSRDIVRRALGLRGAWVARPAIPPVATAAPVMAKKPVFVAPTVPTATVFHFPSAGRCCWLAGDGPKTYRQCKAMAVTGPDVRRPHSYCGEHRALAYTRRADAA